MSGGYMMYVIGREYIEVLARSVLYACHYTFISYNQRSVCAKMRFTVSFLLLVLGSVDWILYQLQTVEPTLEEEGCGHQCESLATAMSSGDVTESDRPKWNPKFVSSYLIAR